MNGTFDGDEMNSMPLMTNEMRDMAEKLKPHYAIHSLMQPGKLNDSTALPNVTVSVLASYLNG